MYSDAANLVARVRDAYESCASYRDEGIVTTTFYDLRRRVMRQPFSTRFVRGRGFRFEYRTRRGEEDWDQYVIWTENSRARRWWSEQPDDRASNSLSQALAGATGVSGGSAYRVPHLLMPERRNGEFTERWLKGGITDVPEAAEQGCIVLEYPLGIGDSEQVWIDRATFLLRRVVHPRRPLGPRPQEVANRIRSILPPNPARSAGGTHVKRGSTEVETVTVYEGAFDEAIAPDELRFEPPAD